MNMTRLTLTREECLEVIQALSDAADDMHNAADCAVHADEIDKFTARAERYDALADELNAQMRSQED